MPVLDLCIGDVLSVIASGALLALLWWPFAAAAVAGGWSAFAKAGRPGWTSLVPVYNGLQFLRMSKSPDWWLLLLFVPGLNVAIYAVACVRLARAFGQEARFAAGLFVLPPVFLAVLGLGRARYRRFDVLDGAGRGGVPVGALGALAPALPRAAPRLAPVR